MIDQAGNGNGDGGGGINRFAQTGPTLIFSLLQQLQALGLNVPEIMSQLGIETNGDEKKITPVKDAVKPAIPTVVPKIDQSGGSPVNSG